MISKLASLFHCQWEYRHFTYPLKSVDSTWVTLADLGDPPEALARQFFWELYAPEIIVELKCWQDEGWEFADTPSANGLNLRSWEYADKNIMFADIVVWITTLGLGFLISALLDFPPRYYIAYQPLEFSVLLRRPLLAPDFQTGVCL